MARCFDGAMLYVNPYWIPSLHQFRFDTDRNLTAFLVRDEKTIKDEVRVNPRFPLFNDLHNWLRVFIVKPIINWALPNSLNAYDRHSDWHKLEVYATKMSTYF